MAFAKLLAGKIQYPNKYIKCMKFVPFEDLFFGVTAFTTD